MDEWGACWEAFLAISRGADNLGSGGRPRTKVATIHHPTPRPGQTWIQNHHRLFNQAPWCSFACLCSGYASDSCERHCFYFLMITIVVGGIMMTLRPKAIILGTPVSSRHAGFRPSLPDQLAPFWMKPVSTSFLGLLLSFGGMLLCVRWISLTLCRQWRQPPLLPSQWTLLDIAASSITCLNEGLRYITEYPLNKMSFALPILIFVDSRGIRDISTAV